MLLCRENGGNIYVKIGMSNDPLKRFRALRTSCPFIPRAFLYLRAYGRVEARHIERDLHAAYVAWHAHNEWFSFPEAEKEKFNLIWQKVLQLYAKRGRTLEWTKISVEQFVQHLTDANRAALAKRARRMSRRGRSYRDFIHSQ